MGPEIDASRGKIMKSSPIGRLNRGFGNNVSLNHQEILF